MNSCRLDFYDCSCTSWHCRLTRTFAGVFCVIWFFYGNLWTTHRASGNVLAKNCVETFSCGGLEKNTFSGFICWEKCKTLKMFTCVHVCIKLTLRFNPFRFIFTSLFHQNAMRWSDERFVSEMRKLSHFLILIDDEKLWRWDKLTSSACRQMD